MTYLAIVAADVYSTGCCVVFVDRLNMWHESGYLHVVVTMLQTCVTIISDELVYRSTVRCKQ